MKKKIAVLLVVLLLLSTLAACAGERHDLLYETTVGDIVYRVRGSGTRAKQIVLLSGGEIIWEQGVKVSKSVGTQEGTYGFEVLDLNFDGNNDFMIANDVAGDCVSYTCWLWDAEKKTYSLSKELSGLCNIAVREELSAVFAFTHTYEVEQSYTDTPASSTACDTTTKYEWIDGKLTATVRASITYYSESDCYCYALSYYDKATGKLGEPDEKWLTREKYQEYDMSFLYYFK